MSNAVAALADFALTARVFCASLASRCSEALNSWGGAWCLFLRRLGKAARSMPRAGFVLSALNTTAANIVQEALPLALAVPITELANGKASVERGVAAVENVTAVFAEYVECAMIL